MDGETTYTIEKGIPIPTGGGSRSLCPLRVALDSLEVGDSLLVADKALTQVQSAIGNATKRNGWKFSRRMLAEGVRVWRIE